MPRQPSSTETSTATLNITGVGETMLATLYCRALDARRATPILGDKVADGLVKRIDYDFESLKLAGSGYGLAIRARHLDDWTSEFIGRHSDAIVLHLACGLDSRAFRIETPPTVEWYDVDFPDTIELRQRFYSERLHYRTIGSSVTAPGWLEQIPDDRPTIVVAEGLSMYLSEAEIKALLNQLIRHFKAGGTIAFDAMNSLGKALIQKTPAMRKTGAAFRWSMERPHDVERLAPALRLEARVALLSSPYVELCDPMRRWACRLLSASPRMRNMAQLLRFGWAPQTSRRQTMNDAR